jgi:S1-C subfamily serine protease
MRVARTIGVLACALAAAGCADLPTPPEDLPATFIPSVAPERYPLDTGDDFPNELELATYQVSTSSCQSWWQGTAFAIGPHMLITNRHVVDTLTQFEDRVSLSNPITTLEATVTAVSTIGDLAIITTDASDELPHVVPLADNNPEPADKVMTIGYPGGGEQSTHVGIVVYLGDSPDHPGIPVIRSNAAIEAGASGSPLFNTDGEVVGVEFAIEGSGYALAMPVSLLRTFIDDDAYQAELRASCDA